MFILNRLFIDSSHASSKPQEYWHNSSDERKYRSKDGDHVAFSQSAEIEQSKRSNKYIKVVINPFKLTYNVRLTWSP